MDMLAAHMPVLTSFNSAVFRGSQFFMHHLSTWPAICILSMTIPSDAVFFAYRCQIF